MRYQNEKGDTIEKFRGRNGEVMVIMYTDNHFGQERFSSDDVADRFIESLSKAIHAKKVEE